MTRIYLPGSPAAEALKALARLLVAEVETASFAEIETGKFNLQFRMLALIGRMLGWFDGIKELEEEGEDEDA